ncbi:hypothetical protein AWRI3579_g1650 [Hanseniaspora osmophila]|uniref:Uncharacterized protein n=1 Tax=Hanseniaspora osmophila TaxID=56408 RepID=A0A1E5RHU9_9ASCO|nr:hypothetical protein AWRI3579_g1650 [Hanseniaspora osmophila]
MMPVSVVPVSHSPTLSVASTNHTITISSPPAVSNTTQTEREESTSTTSTTTTKTKTRTTTHKDESSYANDTTGAAALPMPRNRHKHKRSFAISGDFDFLKQEQDAVQRQRQEQDKYGSQNDNDFHIPSSLNTNNESNRNSKFYLSTGEETKFNDKGIPNALIDLDNVISTLNNTTLNQPTTKSSSGFVKNNNYNYNIRSKSSVVYSNTQSSSGKSSPLSSYYHQNSGFTNHRRSESAPAELDLDQPHDNNNHNFTTNFAFGYANNSNHSLLNDNHNNICEEENEDMLSNPTSPLKEQFPVRTPITPMDHSYQRKSSVPPKMANTYRNIGRQKERYSNYQAYLTSFTNSTTSNTLSTPPSTATSIASRNSTNFSSSVSSESNDAPLEVAAPGSPKNAFVDTNGENVTTFASKENLHHKLNNSATRRGTNTYQYQFTNANSKWKQRQGMPLKKSLQNTNGAKSQPFNFKTTVYDVDPQHDAFCVESSIDYNDPHLDANSGNEANRSPSPKTVLLQGNSSDDKNHNNENCNTNHTCNDNVTVASKNSDTFQKSPPPLKHMKSHSIAIGEQQSNNNSASTTPRKTTPIPNSILMGEPGSAIDLHHHASKENSPGQKRHSGDDTAESVRRNVQMGLRENIVFPAGELQTHETDVISADNLSADEGLSTQDTERTPDSKKRRRSSHIFKSAVSLIRSASSTSLAQSFNSQYKGDRTARRSFFHKDDDMDEEEKRANASVNTETNNASPGRPNTNIPKEKKKKKKLLQWLFKKTK